MGWLQIERVSAKRLFERGIGIRVLGMRNSLDDLHVAPVLTGDDFDLAVRSAKMSAVVVQRAPAENFAARDKEPVMYFAREDEVVAARAAEVRAQTPMVAVIVAAPGGSAEHPAPAMLLCQSDPDGSLVLPGGRARVGDLVRESAERCLRDAGVSVDTDDLRLAWVGEGPAQVTWYVFAAVRWQQTSSPENVTWVPPKALIGQAAPGVRGVYERALRAVAIGQLL
jgi:hypothetical protein